MFVKWKNQIKYIYVLKNIVNIYVDIKKFLNVDCTMKEIQEIVKYIYFWDDLLFSHVTKVIENQILKMQKKKKFKQDILFKWNEYTSE